MNVTGIHPTQLIMPYNKQRHDNSHNFTME